MSCKSFVTSLIALLVAGGLTTAGCGGDSPTSPPTAEPDPPAPPPAPTVSVVEVSPNAATLEVGEIQRFTATARASNGTVISGVDFAWSSNNTAVATISSGGVATAVSAGTATIRATGNGITGAPATVTVTLAPVASVTVAPSSTQEMMVGKTVTFRATVRTAGGFVRDDVSVSWSSSDTSVVTIVSAGVATAVGAGTASVRATADRVASSPVTINVTEPPEPPEPPPPPPMVATVTVSPSEATIEEGQTQQFEAMAVTADGEAVPDTEFTWFSSDDMVATVNANGLATAVAAGTAMITATASGVTSIPSTVTVEESAPVIASVAIMDAMPVMLELGDTHQLRAVASTSDGTMVGGVTFAWSSDDNEVATVDSTGLITAVAAGTANITSTAEEVTSEPVKITVAEPPPVVDRVTVEPTTASIEEGETQQFSATVYDADNEEISGKTFTWESSSTSVATIDTMGLATGEGAGSTTIKATVDGVSGTATLTVTEPPEPPEPPPPPPMVATVTVSPSEATIKEGQTQQFSATAYDADNEEVSGKTFTWTSSNNTVATVNNTGLATAASAGSAIIAASVDEVSGTAALTVTAPLRSRTGSISGRNNYNSSGSVTLSETSDGKLRLEISGLSLPGGAPDVYLALYTSANIDWGLNDSLPSGARSFGEVTGQSGNWSTSFTPGSGENIDTYSHVILHCRLIDREVGSASLSN